MQLKIEPLPERDDPNRRVFFRLERGAESTQGDTSRCRKS